jgi:acyl carrier protein
MKENFLFGYKDDELLDDTSFLEIGVLDSTGIMELVAFLEREFKISVLDEEIIQENLDSIDLISDYLLKKKLA